MKINRFSAFASGLALLTVLGCNTKPPVITPPAPTGAFSDSISAAEQAQLPPIVLQNGPEVLRSRFAHVNLAEFKARPSSSGPAVVQLNLFPDFQPALQADSVGSTEDGFDIWRVRLDTNKLSFATLITSDHTVYAQIQIEGHVFSVSPIMKDIVQIKEVDQAKFEKPDHVPGDWPIKGANEVDPGPTPVSNIDPAFKVLVLAPPVYHYMCNEPMNRVIYQQNFNAVVNAYQPTGLSAVFAFDCIQYTPPVDLHNEATIINNNAEVMAKRDAHKADLVVILAPDGNVRGSTLPSSPSTQTSAINKYASLVRKDHALDDYSMAHELGHSLGMWHDRLKEGNSTAPDCHFGMVFDVAYEGLGTVKARCVHADFGSCNNCPRIGTFSQPYTYHDAPITMGPMGVACGPAMAGPLPADNRSVLLKNWPYARQYR